MGQGWSIPEDRPVVKAPRTPNPARVEDESAANQLASLEQWIEGDDKSIPLMSCILMEKLVEGLIYGGRYLFGWNNGAGGVAPQGQGMPELEVLEECSIDCFVQKSSMKSKGREIYFTLKTDGVWRFVGYDEEGITRPPRTVGPRQSGPTADVNIIVSPSWVTDLTERQREYILFTALHLMVPDESRILNPWKTTAVDISLDSAALQIYGAEMPEGIAVLQAAKRHVQTYLPGMTPAERLATLETLLREQGMTAYKDGKPFAASGE